MPTPDSPHFSLWLMQTFVSLFLAILFLHSGMDKVMDWRGNLGYLQPHFAKSPLASVVPAILLILTLLVVCGASTRPVEARSSHHHKA